MSSKYPGGNSTGVAVEPRSPIADAGQEPRALRENELGIKPLLVIGNSTTAPGGDAARAALTGSLAPTTVRIGSTHISTKIAELTKHDDDQADSRRLPTTRAGRAHKPRRRLRRGGQVRPTSKRHGCRRTRERSQQAS